jgi:hypothetical protein
MLEQITKINNNLSDIRNAISEQGVEIDASTPLAEYADKILEIERPVVEIGQQLYVFYCNAENT